MVRYFNEKTFKIINIKFLPRKELLLKKYNKNICSVNDLYINNLYKNYINLRKGFEQNIWNFWWSVLFRGVVFLMKNNHAQKEFD